MTRTALALTPEQWRTCRPRGRTDEEQAVERWELAWDVARTAATLLREEFGAGRVVVFGSLTHRAWFTPWSDIDLAAWGIAPDAFYRAVALVTGLRRCSETTSYFLSDFTREICIKTQKLFLNDSQAQSLRLIWCRLKTVGPLYARLLCEKVLTCERAVAPSCQAYSK